MWNLPPPLFFCDVYILYSLLKLNALSYVMFFILVVKSLAGNIKFPNGSEDQTFFVFTFHNNYKDSSE